MIQISAIVEYAELDAHSSDGRKSFSIFNENEYSEHKYWGSIIHRLKNENGLYFFYDSMTRPLYVGTAARQKIWKRANQSYNSPRERNGKILFASHPGTNRVYDAEKTRRLKRIGFSLAEVATYFSAYAVAPEFISGLEAFSIRAFGGVLLNTKMEGNGGFGLPKLGEE